MRNLFLVLLVLFSSSVLADVERQSFVFDQVKLPELARLVYGESLREKYILEDEVLKEERLISLDMRAVTKVELRNAFNLLLESYGYKSFRSGGVYFLVKAEKHNQKDFFVYAPKYRDASYLTGILGKLFTGFANARQMGGLPPLAGINSKSADTGVNSLFDKSSDLLVYQGTKLEIERLEQALMMIDKPSIDVLVKGVVYEVSKDDKEGSAVSLALTILNGKFGLSGGDTAKLGNMAKLSLAGGIGLDAAISVFATDNRFKSVSTPSIRVRSGENAHFASGASVPIRSSSSVDRFGNPVSTVDYKPSGIIFDIKPKVRESVIDLDVSQQLSSFTLTTTSGIDSPSLLKREVSTSVSVQSGELIVLGGLEELKENVSRSGLPFLPDWMTSKGGTKSNTEILLVLQVQKI